MRNINYVSLTIYFMFLIEVASFRRSRNTKSRKCGVPEILPSLILAHRIVGGKLLSKSFYLAQRVEATVSTPL